MNKDTSKWIETLLLGSVLSLLISIHVTIFMQIIFLLRNLVANNWDFYELLLFDVNIILFLLVCEFFIFVSVFAIYKKKSSLNNHNF